MSNSGLGERNSLELAKIGKEKAPICALIFCFGLFSLLFLGKKKNKNVGSGIMCTYLFLLSLSHLKVV